MWDYVGIVRSERRLSLAKKRMELISEEIEKHFRDYFVTPNMVELRNISYIAHLIIDTAMRRKESRGLHYMKDYPEKDDEYEKRGLIKIVRNKLDTKKWATIVR